MKTYTPTQKGLHWLMAALIIGMVASGWIMADLLTPPFKYQVYAIHKATGLLVLAFLGVRLFVRLTKGVPNPLPAPKAQLVVADVTHGLIYALMFLMPLTGWLMSSAGGYPITFYGLFTVPPLMGENKVFGAAMNELHGLGMWAFIVLVTLHATAALKHHFVDKDATLVRMLPLWR
jgi:cytochrome b561